MTVFLTPGWLVEAMLNLIIIHGALTGRSDAGDVVEEELPWQADLIRRAGMEMSGWVDAALRLAGPIHEVVVAGDFEDDGFGRPWRAVAASLSPGVVLTPVAANGEPARFRRAGDHG